MSPAVEHNKLECLSLACFFGGRFHKYLMLVNYRPSKISITVMNCINALIQVFQNALAYFAMNVSFVCKMSMKSTHNRSLTVD
jgi:hypothetical protein